jgi:hypothetical protein
MKQLNYCIVILVLLVPLFYSCNEEPICHNEFSIINNSNKAIYCYFYVKHSNNDTSLPEKFSSNINLDKKNYIVTSASIKTFSDYNITCYEYSMRPFYKDFYKLFVIDTATFAKYSTDTIQLNKLTLRYDITLEMMQENNWILAYPKP